VSFKSLIGDGFKWSWMRLEYLFSYTKKVNAENSVDMIFGCIVDGAAFRHLTHDFWILFAFMVESSFPRRFLLLLLTVCRSRFGLHHNSGNRQERNALTSVGDKQLM